MTISPAAYERSTVRSDLRLRALIMLASLGEAFPNQLARALGIPIVRLNAVMFGDPPDYSVLLALLPLGLVEVRDTPHGKVFAITERGRKKARQLTSRWARREEVRRRRRDAREGTRVEVHPGAPESTGGGPPAPPTWSFSVVF